MAGCFPKCAIQHLRRIHFHIARLLLTAAHIGNERLEQRPAFWVPKDRARTFFLKMEELDKDDEECIPYSENEL